MDPANNQQPERLEDQLRRMIIHSNPQAGPQHIVQSHPIVHLPSQGEASHYVTSQFHQGPPPQNSPNGHWRGSPQNEANSSFAEHYDGFGFQRMPQGQWSPDSPRARHQHRGQHRGRHCGGRGNLHHPQHGFNSHTGPVPGPVHPFRGSRHQQHHHHDQIDPNAFQRDESGQRPMGPPQGPRHLFNPDQSASTMNGFGQQHARQVAYIQQLFAIEIDKVHMTQSERDEKDAFRIALQNVLQDICAANPDRLPKVSLECFGSFQSGFATQGSDMDLVIAVKDRSSASACFSLLEEDLPRVLEKRLLQMGYGARLLTRTRVPIIKVCEKPGSDFLNKLREEREKWDQLPEEKKYPHLHPQDEEEATAAVDIQPQAVENTRADPLPSARLGAQSNVETAADQSEGTLGGVEMQPAQGGEIEKHVTKPQVPGDSIGASPQVKQLKQWTRERKSGPLDFPKSGIGIQSDINFFNPLGLHNTQLLRCYSLCDPRVRPMVLFVKAWAKRRKINSSYSGTLSSYGYVLMVLHYLVNVANPSVLPNLQSTWRPNGNYTPAEVSIEDVDGWTVNFWRNEDEIKAAADRGQLNVNRESVYSLLVGFFHYYSSQGGGFQFRWMQQVLSLRSARGTLTKEEKGWVKAVTEEDKGKKVQHRYLFCIEDPFELSHNVARTVTHNGIVAIRDEFRRARRILHAKGTGQLSRDGELFDQLLETEDLPAATAQVQANEYQALGTPAPLPVVDGVVDERIKGTGTESAPTAFATPTRVGRADRYNSKASKLDVHDADAFPALTSLAPKSGKKKPRKNSGPQQQQQQSSGNVVWGEISGDKAKAYLEEVRRKKDEAQAETTATGAAEAVLGGFD